jgi:porphobilinogen deaminase
VLAELAAGCSAPLGAYAAGVEVLQLTATVVAADGGQAVRAWKTGLAAQAARLGRDVAAELLAQGAGTIVAGVPVMEAPGRRALHPAVPPGELGDGDDVQ